MGHSSYASEPLYHYETKLSPEFLINDISLTCHTLNACWGPGNALGWVNNSRAANAQKIWRLGDCGKATPIEKRDKKFIA
mmetsp:Transcript_18550/g.26903  ORF Transcript_18550/g.26903 Transcript_18550/m.26903 type:complete len:80 (+) Transcript_18550:187-426(+)